MPTEVRESISVDAVIIVTAGSVTYEVLAGSVAVTSDSVAVG